tara:strand:+ start:21838 stop:23748 length:1911 start_codon:yes stop_codon:yes gene_type:complete
MKFHIDHILDNLEQQPSHDELSNKLLQLGHENEITNGIIDLEITPNRGDCLSLKGISRDLSFFYGNKHKPHTYEEPISSLDFNFVNECSESCNQISFAKISVDDKPKEYKPYLEKYFKDLKINKKNFFTDISNYISYEVGQPTHCYDFKKMKGRLYLKKLEEKTEFLTLTSDKISLDEGSLIFENDIGIVNLAGVMGGINSSCDERTSSILLECAHFSPEAIIGKTTKYKITSDAAFKFERWVDPNIQEFVIKRFIQIVADHTEIKEAALISFCNNGFDRQNLELNHACIEKILGCELGESNMHSILSNLDFKISEDKNLIQVPSHRNDINSTNDIAEEIARYIGYDNISRSEFKITNTRASYKGDIKNVKNFFIDNGFSEVVNIPFASEKGNSKISIDNPLDQNKKYLRTNILNSLCTNLAYNERRQKDSIKLFEISDIYEKVGGEIKQKILLGVIVTGRLGKNYRDFSKNFDETFFSDLFKDYIFDFKDFVIEIPRDSIDSKSKSPIFALEIELQFLPRELLEYKKQDIQNEKQINLKKISEYPSTFRDVSFSLKKKEILEETINHLNNVTAKYLAESFIFDIYDNKKLQEVKVGCRFVFQCSEKTLTEKDVQKSMDEIISKILDNKDIYVQGR